MTYLGIQNLLLVVFDLAISPSSATSISMQWLSLWVSDACRYDPVEIDFLLLLKVGTWSASIMLFVGRSRDVLRLLVAATMRLWCCGPRLELAR